MSRYRVTTYTGISAEVSAANAVQARQVARLGSCVVVKAIGASLQRCLDCGASYEGFKPVCEPCRVGRIISGRN